MTRRGPSVLMLAVLGAVAQTFGCGRPAPPASAPPSAAATTAPLPPFLPPTVHAAPDLVPQVEVLSEDVVQTSYALPSGGAPVYGHAPDYHWLSGELLYSEARAVWRLRYAPATEDDAYGGSVTLTGKELTPVNHQGACVRVEGVLQKPDGREPNPSFRVEKIQILPRR